MQFVATVKNHPRLSVKLLIAFLNGIKFLQKCKPNQFQHEMHSYGLKGVSYVTILARCRSWACHNSN